MSPFTLDIENVTSKFSLLQLLASHSVLKCESISKTNRNGLISVNFERAMAHSSLFAPLCDYDFKYGTDASEYALI
jgi:hypothetical protein